MKLLPPIIAFCGQATAGKTSAACIVASNYPNVTRISFADPIRDMLKAGFGFTDSDLHEHKHTPMCRLFGKTPREAMQTLGTEWGREKIGRDIWAATAISRAKVLNDEGYTVVFDDCRFDNEAEYVRKSGGIVIRIDRPGLPPPMDHASERGVAPHLINHTLMAADLNQLQGKVLATINEIIA